MKVQIQCEGCGSTHETDEFLNNSHIIEECMCGTETCPSCIGGHPKCYEIAAYGKEDEKNNG